MWKETKNYCLGENYEICVPLCWIILLLAWLGNVIQCACLYTERYVYRYVAKTCFTKGLPIAFKSHYIFIEVIFTGIIVTIEILHLSELSCIKDSVLLWLNFLAVIIGLVSILKYTQLNSNMAHFIIQFDRMLFDVMLMLAVWFLLYFIFVVVFFTLNFPSHCNICNITEKPIIEKDYWGDDAMFTTFWKAAYETFMLGLYIHAPYPLYFEQSSMPVLSMLAYSAFLLLVSLVMVNAIVALMIEKVKQLYKFKSTVKKLQEIAYTMFMDGINTSFHGYFSPFKFQRPRIYDKYFIQTNGKVYIHVTESHMPSDKVQAKCHECGSNHY